MQIEIAEAGRMSQSGESLLRLIQNNDMPILDLLVRESIQNSLDAGNPEYKNVCVDFLTGSFNAEDFCQELEEIGDKIYKKFSLNGNSYIAVKDSHTFGLTGPLSYNEINDGYGNLLKLVYEISKPQDTEGAGGSWGLGKTVYFRVGCGLVVYYSRIKNADHFESRLAVTFVENETAEDSVIPPYGSNIKRGIAWWGKGIGTNKTQPVTGETEIQRILSAFHIPVYEGDETGTTVIIPFIDKHFLLNNNLQTHDEDDNPVNLPGSNSIEDYLKIAIQRWYAPRINNPLYPYGMYLNAFINGEGIGIDDMAPEFRIIRYLYNLAHEKVEQKDIPGADFFVEKIRINKVFDTKDGKSDAGVLACAVVNKKILKMVPPDNYPDPYLYYQCEGNSSDKNKPVICYTRKPGMIVCYKNNGSWADAIPLTDNGHYLICLFVIYSHKKLLDGSTLEEYVRKSELADHTEWTDHSLGKENPRIISKCQKSIQRHLVNKLCPDTSIKDIQKNSGIGRLFGDMFLPPENYGQRPSQKPESSGKVSISSNRRYAMSTNNNEIRYLNDMIEYPVVFTLKKVKKNHNHKLTVLLGVNTESGSINLEDWVQNLGLQIPFYIDDIHITELNSQVSNIHLNNNQEKFDVDDNMTIQLIRGSNDRITGFWIERLSGGLTTIAIKLVISILSRTEQLTFSIFEEEEK